MNLLYMGRLYSTPSSLVAIGDNTYCDSGKITSRHLWFDLNSTDRQADLDVVFVLDTSGATGSANFQLLKSFITNVLDDLNVRPDGTHVGVVSSEVSIPLGSYELSTLAVQIQNISFTGEYTNTASGLITAMSQFDNSRLFQVVPRIIILLTDGISNLSSSVEATAAIRTKGIHLFTVGIGSRVTISELSSLASSPDLVFNVSRFSHTEFQRALRPLQQAACYSEYITTIYN